MPSADTPPAGPPRTVSIGAATVDLFIHTGSQLACSLDGEEKTVTLPLGAKIRLDRIVEQCGGGATNTSVALRRLGCVSGFCGIIGSDEWGERILHNLQREGVDATSATIVERETSSFSVIINVECGERVILYANGPSAHLSDVTFDKESATRYGWVYFNHIHDASSVIQDDIVEILHAQPDIGMTWNPGGRHLKRGIEDAGNRELLRQTDLLLLNKEEALQFTGKRSTERAIQAVLQTGVSIACVSDGANGCEATDGRSLYHCPAVKDAPVIDTTGAGDGFGSGMTWALLCGFDLPTMLKAGTINATSVLAVIGAQPGLLTDIEMHKKLRETHLDVTEKPL